VESYLQLFNVFPYVLCVLYKHGSLQPDRLKLASILYKVEEETLNLIP